VLQTNASLVGLGTILTQTIEEEKKVTAFTSRALADPKRKYSVTEQKAVVWPIQKFRSYLEGYKFTVVTDHNNLHWLHLKNPTSRLARWALELLELLKYDYEVIHRKDALHHVPDALSRIFEGDINEDALAMSAVNLVIAKDNIDVTTRDK